MEILDALLFEADLGISLKKNLHIIFGSIARTGCLDAQKVLSGIALDYGVKSLNFIQLKYDSYYPDH